MLQIYRRLWLVNWAEQWQYRANLLMYLLYWIVSPVVYLSVWVTIANNQGSVQGLTSNDFITYYLTLLAVDILTSDITIHLLAYKIQDGTLSGELMLPIHPILTRTLVNNLAFKALTLMVFVPVWLLLFLLFRPDYSSVTLSSLLIGIPALILGFLINFLLGASLTLVAFWTTRVYALHEFYSAVVVLFAGQFVPLELMPPLIQNVAGYLPFQLLCYFPIQLILNRVPPQAIWQTFGAGLLWLALAWVLFTFVWRQGVKRFSAVGA